MQTDTKRQVYAGFFVRLAAFLVDMLIINVGLILVRIPFWILYWKDSNNILLRDMIFQYSIKDILFYLLTVAYFVLFTYYTGATLGKKLFQLRVVSVDDRKMTLFEVIYRESIGRFLAGIIMNIGYLLVLVQKENRGVHDLLSDTCVVYYHEKKVYVHTQMNYRNMAPAPGYVVPPQAGQPTGMSPRPGQGQTMWTQPQTNPGQAERTEDQTGQVQEQPMWTQTQRNPEQPSGIEPETEQPMDMSQQVDGTQPDESN